MWAMILKFRMWLRLLDFLSSDITQNLGFVHRLVHASVSLSGGHSELGRRILLIREGLFH